ncbi:IPT/TIG domain-containing protein [Paractinoplanes globisporus]|uniref:IPT/TIG domain-containing protein n=1 Tax=Paractinoplanes globisporus TaxID=113565 RepID=A0ABW6WME8_9ACTN|nr:IPT/TIG domain-containing protein [Actinoplanes globisporus]
MSKTKSSTTRRRLGRAGLATGAAAALLTGMTAAPAYATAGTMSLSATGGPTGGGNTVVATMATAPTSPNPTAFTSSTAVYFVVATSATATPACPTAYPTTAPSATVVATGYPNVKLLAPNKIAVLVPTGVAVSSSIFKYAMCAFASNTSGASLIASAQYTVGTAPRIAAVSSIAPVSGPALGGTTVTVTGTGFVANTTAAPNNTTATLDGEPLTNIVVNGGGTSFSATTPPHVAGGPYLLSVTTPGGTANTLGTTTNKANLFSYSNGIVVSPNTAAGNNGAVDLDVLGVGFANLSFVATTGSTPNSANAHVYLSSGGYDEEGTTTKAVPELTECVNVLVIADTELLCSLPLNHTFSNAAAPALSASAARGAGALHAVATSGSTVITSSDAAFTQNDVGLPIVSTAGTTVIPAGATIAAVASSTSATLSVAAAADGSLADVTVGGLRNAAGLTAWGAGTVAADGKTITGTTGFTSADIGRAISSTTAAFPANTTVVGVSGTTVTVSDAGTAGAAADLVLTPSVSVSDGTYTVSVVSDGAIDALDTHVTAGTAYSQSIVSSGSTFTVAQY